MRTHKSANLDNLIATEWDILRELREMLSNPELSTGEKTRVANALACRAATRAPPPGVGAVMLPQ